MNSNWISNLLQSVVFQTVISGVLVFSLSEILQKFFFEPIKNYKEVVGKIDNRLKYYSSTINNSVSPDAMQEPSRILRALSCDLEATHKQIPFRMPFAIFKIVPKQLAVGIAASDLIFLHNAGGKFDQMDHNYKKIQEIRRLLNIKELEY